MILKSLKINNEIASVPTNHGVLYMMNFKLNRKSYIFLTESHILEKKEIKDFEIQYIEFGV